MNAKEILDLAAKIIVRQDLDRSLLLDFINTTRKELTRDKKIKRFLERKEDIAVLNGVIDTNSVKLKQIEVVEWFYTDEDGLETKVALAKIPNYRKAMMLYGSLTVLGSPEAYLESGKYIYILPVPTAGVINIYGEWWQDPLTDSISSSDITTEDIGEVLAYLGAAEYLDMLGEEQRANYWRQKGLIMFNNYMTSQKIQETNNIEMMKRDPWGNRRTNTPRKTVYDSITLEDLDMGGY